MYHYVRPYNSDYPWFKNLDISDFKKQLDFFEKQYGFVSKENFKKSLKNGIPSKGIILTFDDGLFCHYEYVFKELKKRNLWGIFYVPTKPYQEKKILDVHRIHLLLGKYNSIKVYEFLNTILKDEFLDKTKIEEFNELTYSTQQNDHYTLLVKRILNYFISYEYRIYIIDKLMDNFFPNEEEIISRFYLKESEIVEMNNAGMVIGSHTVNHPVMSRLSITDQENEIKNSFKFLNKILGDIELKTFCYPYGGFHSFTKNTEDLLFENNCHFSFNVEQRDIESIDLKLRKQALPRYDCNQFKFGQVRNLKHK